MKNFKDSPNFFKNHQDVYKNITVCTTFITLSSLLLHWCHLWDFPITIIVSHTLLSLNLSIAKTWDSDAENIQSDDEMMTKGILFDQDTTKILAEKFIKVELFMPFPNKKQDVLEGM